MPPVAGPLALVLALALVLGSATGCTRPGEVEPVAEAAAEPSAASRSREVPTRAASVLAVLRDWDARRAAAYAQGDAVALRALYTAGSSAGRRDTAVLQAYRRRGLTVVGLEHQLVAVRALVVDPRRLVARVRDRVARGWVRTGRGLVRLPRDRPDTRVLVLRRLDGDWRVARVRPAQP